MIELLAPAGNPEALRGAVYAGADAVYFGAQAFNARAEAGNFGPDELERAFSFCRTYGVKAYITLNTLVSDRELPDALALIDGLCALGGPDALIVQDLGLAAALHRRYPALAAARVDADELSQHAGRPPPGASAASRAWCWRAKCAAATSKPSPRRDWKPSCLRTARSASARAAAA